MNGWMDLGRVLYCGEKEEGREPLLGERLGVWKET